MIKLVIIFLIIVLLGVFTIPYGVYYALCKDKSKLESFNYGVVKFMFKIILKVAGVNIHVTGQENFENLKKDEAVFIISNHKGYFDILAGFMTIDRRCSIVAKASLFSVPILGYWMKKINCISLKREDIRSGVKMVIDAIELLKKGISVWIFPEGTRNKNEDPCELYEFKDGLFKIPIKTNSYIVPMAIVNSEMVFERQFPFIKAADIYVNIGKCFKASDLDIDDAVVVSKHSQEVMKELIREIKVKVKE